jgi:hypothetical protein
VETIRGSVTKEEKIPVKVVPTKKVSTGFTVASTSSSVNVATESQSAKQGYSLFISILIDYLVNLKHFCLKKNQSESAVEETSRQLGFLRTPGATPRSTSPADREVTPFATPKSQS